MKYTLGSDEFFNSESFISDVKKTGRDKIFWIISHEPETPKALDCIKKLDNVNIKDRQGLSYLHMAALNHKLKTIELLLDKGADPNCTDNMGRFAILFALGKKHPDNVSILKVFLDYGLDISLMGNGVSIRDRILSFGNADYNALIGD